MDYSKLPGFEPDGNSVQNAPSLSAQTDYTQVSGFEPEPEDLDDDSILPSYANGLSPEAPINESPISFWDRAALNLSQIGGSMTDTVKGLQQRGYEVKRDADNELVIKDPKDNLWKRFDAKDPWDASRSIWENIKEAGKDVADVLPDIAIGGVQQGVATAVTSAGALSALATGGALTPAAIASIGAGQAAGAIAATATKTVLGRLVGTYQSNPEEDFADLAKETLMNFGGGVFGVGMKPTASAIGKQLAKAAPVLAKTNNVVKDIVANAYGAMTGVGGDSINYLASEGGEQVGKRLATVGRNLSPDAIKNELKKSATVSLKTAVDNVFEVMRGVAKTEQRNVIKNVADDAVIVNGDDLFKTTLKALDPFLEFKAKDGTSILNLDTALLKGLDNVDIFVKNGENIAASNPGLIGAPQASELIERVLKQAKDFANVGTKRGRSGAKWALEAREGLNNLVDSLQLEAQDKYATNLFPLFSTLKESFDNTLRVPLNKASNGAFDNYLRVYGKAANDLGEYKAAALRAIRADAPMSVYESLLTQISSKAGSKAFQKGAGDQLTNYAATYAPHVAENIKSSLAAAELDVVTARFADYVKSGLQTQASTMSGVGGLLAGSPMGMAAGAVGMATSSPRLALQVTPTMVRAARQVKALTSAMGPKIIKLAETDPRILQQLVELPMQLRAQEDSIKNQLANQIQGAGGGQ